MSSGLRELACGRRPAAAAPGAVPHQLCSRLAELGFSRPSPSCALHTDSHDETSKTCPRSRSVAWFAVTMFVAMGYDSGQYDRTEIPQSHDRTEIAQPTINLRAEHDLGGLGLRESGRRPAAAAPGAAPHQLCSRLAELGFSRPSPSCALHTDSQDETSKNVSSKPGLPILTMQSRWFVAMGSDSGQYDRTEIPQSHDRTEIAQPTINLRAEHDLGRAWTTRPVLCWAIQAEHDLGRPWATRPVASTITISLMPWMYNL
jgi:hypothetical protein